MSTGDTVIEISGVDHAPEELTAQTPFTAVLVRRMPGKDRPDYWLAALEQPLVWKEPNGPSRSITHLIVASRYEGQTITDSMDRLVVGIAYVTDGSLLEDETLEFEKCRYVAIGVATTK